MNTDNKNTDTQTTPRKWFKVPEAAEYLGTTNRMIYNLVRAGRLQKYTPIGSNTLYFSQEQLDNYVMGIEE